jgi:hypothetical protein
VDVGADVGPHPRAHAEDGGIAPRRDLEVDPLFARMGAAQQVLAPVLDPTHGPAGPHGEQTGEHVLRVRVQLAAEGAADVRRDDAHPRLGEPQHARQDGALDVRALRREPDRELFEPRVVARHEPARLQRQAGVAGVG